MSPDELRVHQLGAIVADLACWVVRRYAMVDGWTCDGAPIPPGEVWARQRKLYRLDCAEITVPDGWPVEDTYLEIGGYAYGRLRMTTPDGATRTHAVNEYSRRLPLSGPRFAVDATLAPIRDRQVGLATVGDRWSVRLALVEPGLDEFCRTLLAVRDLATADERYRAELLDLAAQAIGAIGWPTGSADYVGRISHRENHGRHWYHVPVKAYPKALSGSARVNLVTARALLDEGLRRLRSERPVNGSVRLLGYAHTDLDWMWPEPVSIPAVVGTVAGALGQLARMPGYRFGLAGSYLYSLVERHDPEVFGRLTAAVTDGRWELLTGMWVEPDATMLGGESLTRQLQEGQAYFQSRFGRRSEVCWLPDTFGFTGALPQLLAGAGIRYFFTTRLAAPAVTPAPSSLFHWEGIDGTRILAYSSQYPDGYQCVPSVESLRTAWRSYDADGVYPHALQPLGYANGIGPTDGDLADASILASMPGVPAAEFTSAAGYFADAERRVRHRSIPAWRGELYMDGFRGTYTTQGRTKVLHRRAETGLLTAEAVGALRVLRTGGPAEDLAEPWRRLLSKQTHDIVAGTCVGEIHRTAEREFADIAGFAGKATERALTAIADDLPDDGTAEPGLLFVNPTLVPRPVRAELADGTVLSSSRTVPPLGAVWGRSFPLTPAMAVGRTLETGRVRLQLGADGTVTSLYDKVCDREMLAGPANRIRAYLDRPYHWDAWELSANYRDFELEPLVCTGMEVVESGPARAALRVAWTFRDSRIEQDVRVWADSARVDFVTRIDWRERRVLLRTYVPTTVTADHATFECAYGVVGRPTAADTAWDQARYETAAHRFVDLSDDRGGIALLNNGRYGHHVSGGELSLSLLRSPVFPDPYADEGEHEFRYALFPHSGDWLAGGVPAEAADLNAALPVIATTGKGDGQWRPFGFDGLPLALGTLKAGGKGIGLVLRTYEPAGARGEVQVTLPTGWAFGAELDLLEDPTGTPGFTFGPHQIRTWSLDRVDTTR